MDLKIKIISTDEGVELEGTFQENFNEPSIAHKLTPPGISQYIGQTERRLGVLKKRQSP